ncbi:LANO_0H07360g1_1 [Lachancea nothofagi CBS 11611]|uniref:LANO_0H07360g1_1 n=1 Tax=Lachancea nothofagi CBS 11611 TaxID=1266666 RepID=A0A1G4KLH7_9SACH|nr:LANO_0H07360g1_1 [Lachancea nothofagi CBS 11611]
MSILGEELPTTTSEDFGFKPLGEVSILPSFNEKLPFSKLHNFAISNKKNVYVAAGKDAVIVGSLQSLRDQVLQGDTTAPALEFITNNSLQNVVYVGFHGNSDETIVCITKDFHFHVYNISRNEWSLLDIKITDSDTTNVIAAHRLRAEEDLFLIQFGNKTLYSIETSGTAQLLCNDVVAFDVTFESWVVLHSTGTVELHTSEGKEVTKTFTLPQEISEEISDDFQPLSVSSLSDSRFLLVFGNTVEETDQDVMYDQKMYVVQETESNGINFQESFDIAPAFGSVLRNPSYYKLVLSDLVPSTPHIYIITSSNSSEITLLNDETVIQPNQDSDRAVLPINQTTDNDTNPIGLAVDLTSKDQIPEPCQGVDFAVGLPLIYVLNNEGNLSIFALFNSTGIKTKEFSVQRSLDKIQNTAQAHRESVAVTGSSPDSSNESNSSKESNSISLTSTETATKETDSNPSSDQERSSEEGLVASLPNSASTDQNSIGENSFGQNSFGQNSFGQNPFGQNSFGQNSFGQNSFGQNSFGQKSFGQNSFGQNSFGQISPFGAASTTLGKSNNDSSPFSFNSAANESQPSGANKPTFGLVLNEKNDKPTFGESPFAPKDKTNSSTALFTQENTSSAFGKPAFGQSTFGVPDFGKDKFGAFGAKGNLKNDTDKVKSLSGEPQVSKPLFGSTQFGSAGFEGIGTRAPPFQIDSSSKGGFAPFAKGSSPFASLSNGPSPFSNESHSSGGTASPFANLNNKLEEHKQISSPFSQLQNAEQLSSSSNGNDGFNEGNAGKSMEQSNAGSEEDSSDDGSSTAESSDTESEASNDENSSLLVSGSEGINKLESPGSDEPNDSNLKNSLPANTNETPGESDSNSAENLDFNSLAERIKRAANNSSENFPSSLMKESKPNEASLPKVADSAFSKFSNNLSTETTPTFSFADIRKQLPKANETFAADEDKSGNEHKDDITNQSSATKIKTSLKASETRNQSSEEEPIINKYAEAEETSADNSDGQDVQSDREDMSLNRTDETPEENEEESSLAAKDKGVLTTDTERIDEKRSVQEGAKEGTESVDSDESPINVPDGGFSTKKSGTSTENESFDELDDLKEELDQIKSGTEKVSNSQIDNVAPEPKLHSASTSTQTSPVKTSSNETQTASTMKDAAVETEPIEMEEIEVQTFERDEAYQAQEYKPEALKMFYTGAKASPKCSKHSNETLNRIEDTFNVVTAEIGVLESNLQNIKLFLNDQIRRPFERTDQTLYQTYTWRLEEAEVLNSIVDDSFTAYQPIFKSVSLLWSETERLSSEDLMNIEESRFSTRKYYDQLESLKDENKRFNRGLTLQQTQMQHKLRSKLSSAQDRIQTIEATLRLLKIHMSKEDINKAPLITNIMEDSKQRGDLLEAIKLLRKEVSELRIKDRDIVKYSDFDCTIQTAPISELKLKLDTKKEMGRLFMSRTW